MDLHQLQLSYQAQDDRILLRLSFKTEDGSLQEIRAWLTRRLIRNLWPGIIQALETQVALDQPSAAHASAEIVGMEHQACVSEIKASGSFDTPFEAGAQGFPMGEAPILVTAAHFAVNANQALLLSFAADSCSFEVAFGQTMLHGFCTLLQQAVKLSEWDIELRLPGMVVGSPPSSMLN
jgi:hypothetical protein